MKAKGEGACVRERTRTLVDGQTLVTQVVDRMNQHPEKLQGVSSEYRIELTGEGGGSFQLKMQDGKVIVSDQPGESVRATVTLSVADFADLLAEKVSAMALFMQGRVKLAGDMSEAFKLESLLRS